MRSNKVYNTCFLTLSHVFAVVAAAYMVRGFLRSGEDEKVNEETVGRLTGILVGALATFLPSDAN